MEQKPHSPEEKKQRICVEYKGGDLILQPGHKVFEINLKTGVVREHKLYRRFTLFFWRKPVYKIHYDPNLLHIPAYDLYKARITFKHLLRKTEVKVK